MNIRGGLSAFLNLIATKTVETTAAGRYDISVSKGQVFGSGAADGNINDMRLVTAATLGPSSSTGLSLTTGTNLFNESTVFSRVRGFCITNDSGNGQLLRWRVAQAGLITSPETTGYALLPDGGIVAWCGPNNGTVGLVTGVSSIVIDNPGGALTVTYSIVAFGVKV